MSFFNRKIFEVALIAVFCAGLLWWNPVSFLTPIRSALWVAVEPVALFLGYVGDGVSDVFHSFVNIGSIKRENVELSSEVVRLRGQVANLEDTQKENDQLRTEIGASSRSCDLVATALIVGYDSRGAGDWLMINKGSDDGITSGMTVIFGENVLVGTVGEVLAMTARVQLISHPKSIFNVHDASSQAKGVARGKFGLGILFDSVLQTESIREGDSVVTSEWGESYPPGLFVGTIQNVGVSPDGLFQQATIVPPVNFFGIKVVGIVSS